MKFYLYIVINYRFKDMVIFFCVQPSGEEEVTPESFFSNWFGFCADFKDLWKKEQQRIAKEKYVMVEFSPELLPNIFWS